MYIGTYIITIVKHVFSLLKFTIGMGKHVIAD